jgi:hypothetical protein
MTKVNIFLFILFLCCASSCNKDTDRELECTIEIQNKDLKEAITEYQEKMFCEFKEEIEHGDSVYVEVWRKDINDSISRYILDVEVNMEGLKYDTPFDLCKINGHYVIVSHRSVYHFHHSPITLTEEVCRNYEKKLFPKQYERRDKKLMRSILACGPECYYLTFLRDSLIDKTLKFGMRSDKIHVKLNGKEVYL